MSSIHDSVAPAEATAEPILQVEDLSVAYHTDDGVAEVLDGVSLSVGRGEIVGIVGESGCGKSTLVKTILGILPRASAVRRGRILLEGLNLLTLSERKLTADVRGNLIGLVPQDPFLAFNPVFRVEQQLMEIMRWSAPQRGRGAGEKHRKRLIELLRLVQISDPEEALKRYPHEFSGGQRQRILIAAALACNPHLIIADEPTTALDVTTQLEILRLLDQLVHRFGVGILFVTHDFGVVAQLCHRVVVIYAGQVVETGPTIDVLESPAHPYTRMLIACHPDHAEDLKGIPGSVPLLTSPPSGCRFHPRCPSAFGPCAGKPPEPRWINPGHSASCYLCE